MLGIKNVFNLNIERIPTNASRYIFAIAALLVALLVIYWPSFKGDWYLDDFGNIHDNPNIHLKTLSVDEITKTFYGMDKGHSRFNRPLSYLSLALNYYVGGTDPFGYHIVNFSIHYCTSVFLFLLILNILELPGSDRRYENKAYSIALLATFLWATHPIQVNAVTYIVQRMAALAGLFTVISLYCYLKARTDNHSQGKSRFSRYGLYAACVIAGICALASKQNAAMLPISLLLFEILLIQKAASHNKPAAKNPTVVIPEKAGTRVVSGCRTKPVLDRDPGSGTTKFNLFSRRVDNNTVLFLKILIPPVLIFLLLSLYMGGLSSFQAGYTSRPFSMTERLLTEPRVIFFYMGQLLYPSGSTFALLHDIRISTSLFSPWTTLPAILLLALSVGGCLLGGLKWPLFSFSYLFFFINHAIEGSIVPLELLFEHRNYLPSLFFFILPAIAFIKVVDYFSYSPLIKKLSVTMAIVLLMAQAHTTYQQNALFSHPIIFWKANVKAYPNLHRPRHNLAKALLIYGLADEAENQMYLSLDGKSSARVYQKYITHYNLGVYRFYKMEYQQALKQFSIILKSYPNHIKTLQKTAELYLETGNSRKALHFIEKALTQAPESSSLHIIKGFILLSLGKVEEAFSEAVRAETLNHGALAVAYIMGEGFRLKGDLDQALKYFEKIALMGRDHYAAVLSLVELYYLTGNFSRLDRTLVELKEIAAGRELRDMLAAYDRRWNFVGKERMDNLTEAMKKPE
jgi:tetratricopeptide (TPR) repeat protein